MVEERVGALGKTGGLSLGFPLGFPCPWVFLWVFLVFDPDANRLNRLNLLWQYAAFNDGSSISRQRSERETSGLRIRPASRLLPRV